jgi:phosphate transport system substrate-binding protein
MDQLKAGRADLAVVVLPTEEESALAEFESFVFAYQLVTVLVPATLPLDQVTLEELGGIFGEGGPSSLSRWGDLGLAGERAISAIEPHVPAVGRGIAVEFFRHVVLHDRAFKSTVGRYATLAELPNRLQADGRAIALAAVRPVDSALRAVPVALRAGEPAFSPTPENVHSGDYPLRLAVRLVCRHDARPGLAPLLRHFFSDAIAARLELAELQPLLASARRQQALALEKP